MQKRIATVSQINAYIKMHLDKDAILQDVWIRGEISNFKLHYSGHMYLSLKDDGSVLRSVMFRGDNSRLGFVPSDGMKVLARGRISAYERDGQYQLYISEMIPDGVGELFIAYEQLRAKLSAEGLFDDARKKPIPRFPGTIGVITGDKSAALHDILNILGRRYPMGKILIYPVLVQGEAAARQLTCAVSYFNKQNAADLIIIGRGGGSFEDLAAFNDEALAREIAASHIPVISAVGHETDFTICDFVSDLRAPTPSAAAELASVSVDEISSWLEGADDRLRKNLAAKLSARKDKLERLCTSSALLNFGRRINEEAYRIDGLQDMLCRAMEKVSARKQEKVSVLAASLDAMSPLKVLGRGYAVIQKDGKTIKNIDGLTEGDDVNVTLSGGKAECVVRRITHEV